MSNEDFKQAALDYHRMSPPGKIKVSATKPMLTQRDLSLAYSPGVAYACEAIKADPQQASELTARGNLVAVISNGTAVLGLGNIGALAGKPVMEGKGVLFQKFAGIDVFDIEVDETDPDKLVDIIASLEPTFGGINLEDIKAPECFIVERKLRERMKIPVFHDDQHGTAIIVGAAVLNAMAITGKKIEEVKLATTGMGAAGISCVNMLVQLGLKPENILAFDREGVIHTGRTDLDPEKLRYARDTDKRTLAEIVDGADIFLGLSAGGILKPEMVATMADKPVILALAMGAAKVFATGRNQALLKKLHQIDPRRVVPITLGERPTAEIVMEATGGYGVDALIETLGPNAPVATVLDSFNALRRGGKAINIGGVADPIPLEPFPLMCLQKSYIGSLWFTTAEGQDMAAIERRLALQLAQEQKATLKAPYALFGPSTSRC